ARGATARPRRLRTRQTAAGGGRPPADKPPAGAGGADDVSRLPAVWRNSAASVHRRRARRDFRLHPHDRRDVLLNWVAPEPLVAGAMVAVGSGDLPDWDLRRGLGLPHRRRRRRSRRADTLGPTARLLLCAPMPAM